MAGARLTGSTFDRQMMMSNPSLLQDAASQFLKLVSSGQVAQAYERYAAKNFRHHNAYFPGNAKALQEGMQANADQNPAKHLEVHRVLQDGNEVAILSHVRHHPGERGFALVHIFRFEGDRIAELWDVAQQIPDESPNENGVF